MNEESEVLKLVCQRLEGAGIAYMVTGSFAANVYATPRMTRDIDIVIELKPEDTERFYALFKDDFYVDLQTVRTETERARMFNVIHNDYAVKVDFVVLKDSEFRQTEFGRRQRVRVFDMDVFFTTREDLVLSKLIWARNSMSELQLKDVKKLLSVSRPMDHSYLQGWIERLGLDAVYRKALE